MQGTEPEHNLGASNKASWYTSNDMMILSAKKL